MKISELHQKFLSCQTICTDTRKITKDCMFFCLKGTSFDGNKFAQEAVNKGAKFAIIDNDTYSGKQTILVNNVLETLQKLASYHRSYLKTPIIAITGSNGKTTTKELLLKVLSTTYNATATQGNLNNHIGVPLTLLSMTKNTEIGIVEMGANHQKEIEFLCQIAKPDYGYITNFGKAHLEGFGGVEGVIKGKSELYNYLIANKKQIFVNTTDPIQTKKTKTANAITFGESLENSQIAIQFIDANPFVSIRYKNCTISSQLIGNYNFNNIAAAITIGNYFKVSDVKIKAAVESYVPNDNRSQIINKGSLKIILDAYNANPTSIKAALLNFSSQKDKTKLVILGDMFELGEDALKEHQAIVDLIKKLDIKTAIFIGDIFYKTINNDQKFAFYKTFKDFEKKFNPHDYSETSILIKGSRGMALERVVTLFDNK